LELRAENLLALYPGAREPALRGVDFSAARGVNLVLGPTGAGKTTLLRALAGQLPPASGRVRLDGRDTGARPLLARQAVAYVPQDIGLPDELTLREYLQELAALDGLPPGACGSAAREAAAAVHLEAVLDRRLRRCSGGMRRRALLAQALLRHPQVLLADEPTAGLDPVERLAVQALLRAMAAGACVVLATHFVADAAALGGRATVLAAGRVLAALPVAELLASARGQVWGVGAGLAPSPDYLLQPTAHPGEQRLLGTPPALGQARPLAPTLEDAYLLLLRRARAGGDA